MLEERPFLIENAMTLGTGRKKDCNQLKYLQQDVEVQGAREGDWVEISIRQGNEEQAQAYLEE